MTSEAPPVETSTETTDSQRLSSTNVVSAAGRGNIDSQLFSSHVILEPYLLPLDDVYSRERTLSPAATTSPDSRRSRQPLLLSYDENLEQVIVAASDCALFVVQVGRPPHLSQSYPLGCILSGPVLSVKQSPSGNFLAIQRSAVELEIFHLREGRGVYQKCKPGGKAHPNRILGFFWSGAVMNDFLMVTAHGLEYFKLQWTSKKIRPVKSVSCLCNWFCFSPEANLVLLSTGVQGNVLQGYQTLSKDVVKINRFEVDLAPLHSTSPSNTGKTKLPQLSPQDVVLGQIYDDLYCIHMDRARHRLVLYQIRRDSCIKTAVINLHNQDKAFVNIKDNLIIAHSMESKITMIFDTKASAQFPVAAPLPLCTAQSSLPPTELYTEHWRFLQPHFIVDSRQRLFWTIRLNLEDIALSGSDFYALIDFLLRRSDGEGLVLRVLNKIVGNTEGMYLVSRVFHLINSVAHEAVIADRKRLEEDKAKKKAWFFSGEIPTDGKLSLLLPGRIRDASSGEGELGEDVGHAVLGSVRVSDSEGTGDVTIRRHNGYCIIDQSEVYTAVFLPFLNEIKNDSSTSQSSEARYLAAVITEYIRSLNHFRLPIDDVITSSLVTLQLSQRQHFALHQFIQYKVIPDSANVAEQLLAVEEAYPPSLQLALDMFHRLGMAGRVVSVLVSKARYSDAVAKSIEYAAVQNNLTKDAAGGGGGTSGGSKADLVRMSVGSVNVEVPRQVVNDVIAACGDGIVHAVYKSCRPDADKFLARYHSVCKSDCTNLDY